MCSILLCSNLPYQIFLLASHLPCPFSHPSCHPSSILLSSRQTPCFPLPFIPSSDKLFPAEYSVPLTSKKAKASSYMAQYPVLRTVQSALHFISLTDLFTQTPSQLLWEASSHMLQLMCEGCSYTHPPLTITRYSFIQLSELEQCRVKKTCPMF